MSLCRRVCLKTKQHSLDPTSPPISLLPFKAELLRNCHTPVSFLPSSSVFNPRVQLPSLPRSCNCSLRVAHSSGFAKPTAVLTPCVFQPLSATHIQPRFEGFFSLVGIQFHFFPIGNHCSRYRLLRRLSFLPTLSSHLHHRAPTCVGLCRPCHSVPWSVPLPIAH